MGWCSATEIFDGVCNGLLSEKSKPKKETIIDLINALEDGDWDCQQDSEFYEHPIVQEAFRELHPSWFEEDAT